MKVRHPCAMSQMVQFPAPRGRDIRGIAQRPGRLIIARPPARVNGRPPVNPFPLARPRVAPASRPYRRHGRGGQVGPPGATTGSQVGLVTILRQPLTGVPVRTTCRSHVIVPLHATRQWPTLVFGHRPQPTCRLHPPDELAASRRIRGARAAAAVRRPTRRGAETARHRARAASPGSLRGGGPPRRDDHFRLSSNGCGWVEARSAGRRGVLAVHLTGGGRGAPWPGVGRSGVAAGRPACQRATRVLRCATALRVTHRPSLRSSSRYGPCGPAWTGASRPSTTTRKSATTGGLGIDAG